MPPSSGRGTRNGRRGAASSRSRAAANWRTAPRPAASTSCCQTTSGGRWATSSRCGATPSASSS
eukprot:11242255-Alexandrium_andersonii.AAC.1